MRFAMFWPADGVRQHRRHTQFLTHLSDIHTPTVGHQAFNHGSASCLGRRALVAGSLSFTSGPEAQYQIHESFRHL